MSQDSRENFGVKTQISIDAWLGRAWGGGRKGTEGKKRQKGYVESQIE